ncbi:MAG: hypothetical protein AB8B55_19830, partial [Mariniblastus sp.]
DLIFPHHECEIAQSCGATGEDSFAKFWIHARFLFVEGEKMSKSKGNFYTARDVFEGKVLDSHDQPCGLKFHPSVLRYELIKSHYRSNMNFTLKGLVDSQKAILKMVEFRKELEEKASGGTAEVDMSHDVLNKFATALADDLNISGALGEVHKWMKGKHSDANESLAVWKKINSVLEVAPINEGIEGGDTQPFIQLDQGAMTEAEANELCKEMDAKKKEKDYGASDAIRSQLNEAGFEVMQSPDGSKVKQKLG